MKNLIHSINGPVVTVADSKDFFMQEMVYVGDKRLVGEVIGIENGRTVIQVYEETTGLKVGEAVIPTGSPMSVTLGPGIIGNIFDGIERPLREIESKTGPFIGRGCFADPLGADRLWDVTVTVKVGDEIKGGSVYATCPETDSVLHKCLVPPYISGKVVFTAQNGKYKVHDTVVKLEDKNGLIKDLTLCQTWPIRTARPIEKRLECNVPLITGQRVIDTIAPLAKGGTAAIPGGFGTGKTMTQHQLAKWCDADIIVYVG
ncbi:MAG: V-type ATP synthase subunit A, partial [Acutalibacteraceae bacterium]